MKYIKQHLWPISGLMVFDQAVKVVIYYFFFNIHTEILGNMVRFRPVFNTNLSWGGNFSVILSDMIVVVLLNMLIIALFLSGYAFYRSKRRKSSAWVDLIYITGLAGSLCSLIDKVIWGGSLDFIQLPALFTFDVKECYLTIAQCLFVCIGLKHHKEISVTEYVKWCVRRTVG